MEGRLGTEFWLSCVSCISYESEIWERGLSWEYTFESHQYVEDIIHQTR